jgi:hypothetical protein
VWLVADRRREAPAHQVLVFAAQPEVREQSDRLCLEVRQAVGEGKPPPGRLALQARGWAATAPTHAITASTLVSHG